MKGLFLFSFEGRFYRDFRARGIMDREVGLSYVHSGTYRANPDILES